MEHKSLDRVRAVADVLPNWLGVQPLSKCERLERWAEALERQGGRRLKTLFEIEYAAPRERAALRADDSPITVAFKDPRLCAEGLAGDTVGDATAFFGISEWELHNILCFCHHGETMSADVAAVRVRAAAAHFAERPLRRSRTVAFGSVVAALTAVGVLLV
jgi:hypothetical protein